MSEVAEFKVAHLYPPYQGKGMAAIVAHDGTKYKCEESQLQAFREGEDVAIYFENKSFKGKTGENVSFKKFVSKIVKANGSAPQKQFTKARMDPTDSLEARKTSWGAAFIAAGKCALNKDAMQIMLNEIELASRSQVNPQRADDLEDEIPY